uniref:Uncharacterized protein n=1 Tax=Anopheles culicifacies TaxID=139723 RepID=A0A182MRQ5_9DIPT
MAQQKGLPFFFFFFFIAEIILIAPIKRVPPSPTNARRNLFEVVTLVVVKTHYTMGRTKDIRYWRFINGAGDRNITDNFEWARPRFESHSGRSPVRRDYPVAGTFMS